MNFINSVWKPSGSFEVFYRQFGLIIIHFSSEIDCTRILKEGPNTFNSRIMILKQWKKGMKLTRDFFTFVPIWIKFHDLNLKLWTKDSISIIASTLGKPIKMDNNIAKELR